ncbi:MAG: DUF1028 domain-containing protein [Phycisphaerae bacterium]
MNRRFSTPARAPQNTLIRRIACVWLCAACAAPPVRATWSIILVDTETTEIAVGGATCLTFFDLRQALPVIRIGQGAGCAQSFVDTTGQNRRLIWDELARGTAPATILELLAARDSGHQTRQYGIVDVFGRAITFSGSSNGAFASGLTGRTGNLVFSVQGNVLTGEPVLTAARDAILNTPGGLPEKLMAAMEAARAMGGDGRCSCAPNDPTGCGAPPPAFEKSAHIGFMLDARRGDSGGSCTQQLGCANGNYYMQLNVAGANADDPDPVITLRQQFDAFRAGLIDVPDIAESRVSVAPAMLSADGSSRATMRVDVLDWRGMPAVGLNSISVVHDTGSAGSCAIGAPLRISDHTFQVELTAGATVGVDRLRIGAFWGPSGRSLLRRGVVRLVGRGDMNGDGMINNFDVDAFVLALNDSAQYRAEYPGLDPDFLLDVDADGFHTGLDIDRFVDCIVAGACP